MRQRFESRTHLIHGLVGDRVELYQTSAHFRAAVDALADMLPFWIDGIAAQSARVEKDLEAMLHVVEKGLMGRFGVERELTE